MTSLRSLAVGIAWIACAILVGLPVHGVTLCIHDAGDISVGVDSHDGCPCAPAASGAESPEGTVDSDCEPCGSGCLDVAIRGDFDLGLPHERTRLPGRAPTARAEADRQGDVARRHDPVRHREGSRAPTPCIAAPPRTAPPFDDECFDPRAVVPGDEGAIALRRALAARRCVVLLI
ncbi:MAG: hypothetical protein U1F36_14095 [Planctomycetota bacterium]